MTCSIRSVHLIVMADIDQDDVVVPYRYLRHDAVTHVDGNRREWGEPLLQAMWLLICAEI